MESIIVAGNGRSRGPVGSHHHGRAWAFSSPCRLPAECCSQTTELYRQLNSRIQGR